jgi:hypothetical protein
LHYDLSKHINETVSIRDDRNARAFLVEHGIQQPETSHLTEPSVALVEDRRNPTHWIVCMIHVGHKNPADNGYLIHCLPKSRFNHDMYKEFISTLIIDSRLRDELGGGHTQKPSDN